MEILGNIEQILRTKEIGEISFLRTSFFDARFAGVEQEEVIAAFVRFVLTLKKDKPTNYTILKNTSSLLLTFDFQGQCLVNLAFASWTGVTTPVLKIEVVGKNGMIQYDTQADNAYAGTYYDSPASLKQAHLSDEYEAYLTDLVDKIQKAQVMEVQVG